MIIKLKDLADIYFGVFEKPRIGEVVYLQVNNFNSDGTLKSGQSYRTVPLSSKIENCILGSELILFAAKGTRNFAHVFSPWWTSAVASSSFLILRCKNEVIIPDYLAFYINLERTQKYFKEISSGTNLRSIRKADLEELAVSVPPLETQHKLIQLKNLYDAEKTLLNQLLQKKEILYQSLFNKIVKGEFK